jgi:glycosyltransferase involved in cell wall biosynthesis
VNVRALAQDRPAGPEAPRFTIVLPTHNRADVLPFAIRSALWQTVGDFELLIAGDGCTDRTSEVVASFDDPRIRWFDLPKAPGIGYANRNVALREARGHYIAYLAHDDIWFPDHLERLGGLLDATGAEFAYSRGLGVAIDGRMMPYWYNLGIPQHQGSLWRGDSAITMCTVVHARSCLTRYGYWDEAVLFGADIVMWHRILAAGRFRNLAFVSEPTSLHFVANWRNTRTHRSRSRLAGWLIHDFVDQVLPPALRLPETTDRTQQEAAWLRLATDPLERVREIREAVVQLSDALLWGSRTQPRFVGLRSGLMLGAMLERLWRGGVWVASPARRRVYRNLRNRTRALERTAR